MDKQLESYVKSILPDPYIIMGVKLRPFSLGHLFLMRRFDCSFGDDAKDKRGGFIDLFLGISICSRTYEDFLEFIEDKKEFNRWCREWGKKTVRFLKKNPQFNILGEFQKFSDYIKDGIVIPKYWEGENKEDSERSGAHWSQSVLVTLISELNYSRTDALNSPLSQTLSECFKLLENKGALSLMTSDEIELIELSEKKSDGK